MPSLWCPGAIVVTARNTGGRMDGSGGDRLCTQHTFESNPHKLSAVAGARYLRDHGSDTCVVFNPVSGQIAQMLPITTASRTLRNAAGGGKTNAHGVIHPQWEVIAMAKSPWTRYMTAAGRQSLERLLAWQESWGIPRQWIRRPPSAYPPGDSGGRFMPVGGSGYTAHGQWAEGNSHGDPGAIGESADFFHPLGGGTIKLPVIRGGKYLTVTGSLNEGTVRVLQLWLNSVRREVRAWPVLIVDGKLGPQTRKALQGWLSVDIDGDFGPISARAAEKALGVAPSEVPGWWPGIIRALQRKLNGALKGGLQFP